MHLFKESHMSIASRRLGSAVALAAVLLAAPALAAEHRTVRERSRVSGGAIDHALAGMWHEFMSLFAATGSGIDPFGGH